MYDLRYPGAGEVHTNSHRAAHILETIKLNLIRGRSKEVWHICREKKCVSLQHLYLVTSSENKQRKICHQDGQYYQCEPLCLQVVKKDLEYLGIQLTVLFRTK